MTARVAINGFGRIGRLGLRAMLERHKTGVKRRCHQRHGRSGDQCPSVSL